MIPVKFGLAYQSCNFVGFRDIFFTNYKQLNEYVNSQKDAHLYEIISGKQCLYFDFDSLQLIKNEDFEILAFEIKKTFPNNNIRIDLYNSNGFEKYSYHVIVKGIYFVDHLVCGSFAKKIISCLDNLKSLANSFDSSVYTSRRNFRLLGSRKLNSTRIKKFDKNLFFDKDPKFDIDDQLNLSLITQIENSAIIENPIKIENSARINEIFFLSDPNLVNNSKILIDHETSEWSTEQIVEIDNFLEKYFKDVFVRKNSDGNFILLSRKNPGMCITCKRIHTAENAYFFKNGKNIFFVCRRNNDAKYLINENWSFEVKVKPVKTEKNNHDQNYLEKNKSMILKKIKIIYGFE